ncbi:MAG: excinuclease ABC subunit UvrC [Lachnospiraceae bacterium]|nr:excinuclease ABC subunit UvrC [Lachnospiraceae bacterium]
MNFEEELKKLPDQPGVYLMHNEKGEIIYIGKARSLRHRVRQYFQPSHSEGLKKDQMVSKIAWFEYILTDSELEALVLECNLIKEHTPKYNTMLRDDKTYPYIKVTLQEPYPRILFSRKLEKGKAKYFGPYTSAQAVKETIELLRSIYRIRDCSRILPRDIGKERACLNYHIGRCAGVCQGYVTEEEYRKHIEEAMEFLQGNYKPILTMLEGEMKEAAEALEFEKAAEKRDLYNSVKQIAQKQKITSYAGEDKDIVALAMEENDAVVQVFFIRGGKLIGREHFYMRVRAEDSEREILHAFLRQYYSGTPFIPREIHLKEEPEDRELIEEWLSGRRGGKVSLLTPKRGLKERLVELAEKNALQVLEQDRERIKREEGRTIGAVKEIEELLGLEGLSRMEAYDISNTSGFQSVGSMVVFEKGKPAKSEYRKFRLKTVQGPDDYASMREVLTRRFLHREKGGGFERLPDILMMDGGRGQVNIALSVLEELKISIPVCGMVKDDNHRTRGLYYQNTEVPIDRTSEGFKLITRIQDEAHRFAIEYHRSLRGQAAVHSVLDEIPGIGPKRRKALMKRFPSIEEIREAEVETLMTAEGMNERAARAVYEFFHTPG